MRKLQVMPKVRIGFAVAVIALGGLCLGVAHGQGSDEGEPINGQLKRISSQIGQLRQITLSSSHLQKGEAGEIRKQLNHIDQNIQQLEEFITLQDQSSQHRLDQLEAVNRWLIAAIGLLALVMLFSLRCFRVTPSLVKRPSEKPQQTAGDSVVVEEAPVDATSAAEPVDQPLEAPEKLYIGNLVAVDVEQTHQILIEAQKGFMRPAEIKKTS